jgi:hypothetical protein
LFVNRCPRKKGGDKKMYQLISDYLHKKKPGLLQLEELANINLCDLWVIANNIELRIQKGSEGLLRLKAPTLVYATFGLDQFKKLEPLLCSAEITYSTTYYPPYYYKRQGNKWLVTLELECAFAYAVTIVLQDFSFTCGKIAICDTPVEFICSGGTGQDGYDNWTRGFSLIGENRMQMMKLLIQKMSKAR